MAILKERKNFALPLPLCFIQAPKDWMMPTRNNEGGFLYSVYSESNANLFQRHPQKCFTRYLGVPWASKVDM